VKTPYTQAIEQSMKEFFNSLSEKDRRRYAAIEAQKLGHAGITYIAKVLNCSRSTIHVGLNELGVLLEKKQTPESDAKAVDAKTMR
jgi:hypothetical protein